mmetsp:Transcript_8650/g.11901  ORF Transcript_8650/g.11901 Transcript_8650/m.11901 type:complete len:368 (+) Transcript_8650:37-1140(+)|eukprot:CAMPEP_0185260138 /NCGR_PEP_ID=MMETSP1359-20130426/8773_1 /TAXON_ID=552665 /ORGANISM="Bigelowiella longifila, Strain CCMP242" /LENGTH=367 /DNA_ID=CAMNT_0027846275 /DNA_START=28 /DNA_END=1131 /DNA_ORIENTATION=-
MPSLLSLLSLALGVPAFALYARNDDGKVPRLNITKGGVVTAGCSHAGDFAHQFHISFNSMIDGACVFSGQPFHCAVTKFPGDQLVKATNESSVPHCDGCPDGETLVYDHCKNHPQWVDVGMLPDYPRRACGQNPIKHTECIDDVKNLFDDRVYLFRPTHDRCYLDGAVANVQALYGQMLTDPASQVKFVNDQPFPHTLPTNSTPYFNHSEPAGFDGPGECLRWVFKDKAQYAGEFKPENVFEFNQTLYMDDFGVGINEKGFIYIPDKCRPAAVESSSSSSCNMVLLTNSCHDFSGGDVDWAKYGEANGIVILKPCVGGHVDTERFPQAHEVQRGLLDVYGQLSDEYVFQSAPHMRFVGRILREVTGW